MQLNRSYRQLGLVCALAISVAACGTNGAKNMDIENEQAAATAENTMSVVREEVNKNKMTAQMMTMKGQIIYQTMEGGFYSFIADDGSKYTPMQLPQIHKRDGLIVEIQAEEMLDVMTTTQFGKVIKIHNVSVLDESKVTEINKNL